MPMHETDARRCAWLLLKTHGVKRAQRVATTLCDALALLEDDGLGRTWREVRDITAAPAYLGPGSRPKKVANDTVGSEANPDALRGT